MKRSRAAAGKSRTYWASNGTNQKYPRRRGGRSGACGAERRRGGNPTPTPPAASVAPAPQPLPGTAITPTVQQGSPLMAPPLPAAKTRASGGTTAAPKGAAEEEEAARTEPRRRRRKDCRRDRRPLAGALLRSPLHPDLHLRRIRRTADSGADLPTRRRGLRPRPAGRRGAGRDQRGRDRLWHQPQRLLGRGGGLDAVHAEHLGWLWGRRQRRRRQGPLQPRRRDLRRRPLPECGRDAGRHLRRDPLLQPRGLVRRRGTRQRRLLCPRGRRSGRRRRSGPRPAASAELQPGLELEQADSK